jgi:hypothetical protein
VGHGAGMGENINTHKSLVGKREGKIPLGVPRRGWEDNIRRDVK